MTGEVTALEVELDAEGTFTVVRGYDLTHRLRHGSRVTTYLNQSYDQIVRKVLQGANLVPGTIERTSTVHAHVGQANVDDRTFCQRLAAEVGFRFGMRNGKVDFCRPTEAATAPPPGPESPLRLVPDRNLLSLRAAVSAAEQVPMVRVRGWDPVRKAEVVAEAPAAASGVRLPKSSPKALAGAVGARLPLQAAVHTHRLRGTADSAAKATANRIGACSAEIEAVALGDIALHPGAVVTLDNLGEPFDGGYTVSRARHVFDPELGYTTTLSVSGAADRSLLGLTGGGPVPPAPRRPGLRSGSSRTTSTRSSSAASRSSCRGSPSCTRPTGHRPSSWARARGEASRSSPRSTTRCWSRSSMVIRTVPTCSVGCTARRTRHRSRSRWASGVTRR